MPVARCLAAGLRFRSGRSWTVPTGHQDPSRQARRCHAGGVTEGVSFQKIPSPLPPPTHALFRRRGARWRGRGKLFYTSHFKGAAPLWNPRGMVALGFFFVLLKGRTCLPLWGRRWPVGTVLRRSPLPLRSVLGAPHWGAGPEPAGETVSSQGDDGGGLAGRLEPSPLPPPVVTVCAGEGLAATGGGGSLFLSQGGRGPPWESPFSRGRASLREGGVIARR